MPRLLVLLLLGFAVVVSVFFVLLPNTPTHMPIPYRDSGVFLYIGSRVVDGQIPYRDIWDHKPPAIFYINALGLALTNGSRWGVWLLEFMAVVTAALFSFLLNVRMFRFDAAAFGMLAWIITLPLLLAGGNLTEEFALPFQFGMLLLLCSIHRGGYTWWKGLALGADFAIVFLLKQNLVGLWLAAGVYLLLVRRYRGTPILSSPPIASCLGALIVLAVTCSYFALHHALDDLWDAVFRYNRAYTVASFADRVSAVVRGVQITSSSGLFPLAAGACIVAVAHGWRSRRFLTDEGCLLCIVLIAAARGRACLALRPVLSAILPQLAAFFERADSVCCRLRRYLV